MLDKTKVKYCPFELTYVLKDQCTKCENKCEKPVLFFIDDCLTKNEIEKLNEKVVKALNGNTCVVVGEFKGAGEEIASINGFDFIAVCNSDKEKRYISFIKRATKCKKPVIIATNENAVKIFDNELKEYIKEESFKAGGHYAYNNIKCKLYNIEKDEIKDRDTYFKQDDINTWLQKVASRTKV